MSVVTVTITSNGKLIDPAMSLLSVDITHEFNSIPSAELSYIDGDLARQEFEVSDSAFFEPGQEIEIKLKYEDDPSAEKTVFKGVVLKQGLQTDNHGSTFIAELSERAVKMTGVRNSVISENKKDSDVIKQLITNNGIKAGTIETTKVVHKKIVQYNVTDWDFMLSRAEVNGLFISVEAGTISVKSPTLQESPVMSLLFGRDDIYDFELEVDARHQFASIESSIWDVKKQKLTAPKLAKKFSITQGDLKAEKLAKIVGGEKDTLISAVSIDEQEAQSWADAKMARSRLSMLKGRVKIAGSAKVKVGSLIELKGMGKRFSGTTLVTGIKHAVTLGQWTTDIQFGLDAEWFLSKSANVVTPKAAGLLPGVNGLQIGVVAKNEDDPEKEDRVLVMVPAMGNENSTIWARLVSVDAGKDRGVKFWPEPGDEVILGFLNDDPRQPVILGSVHSSANPSPVKAVDKNPEKGIITRQGLKMMFNDEDKIIVISTSDDNVITINEKEKSIEVKDSNKNSVKLSDKGIAMESNKDIIIKSAANVKIEGAAVEIKGNKVDVI